MAIPNHWPSEPAPDRLDLWFCEGVTSPDCEDLTACLNSDERERAARFRFAADRRRFVGSRALLRIALSRYCALPPSHLRFCEGKWGKPALLLPDREGPALHFSLSRSHDAALLAVGGGSEIGADIEFRRPERADSGVVERQFSEPEQHYVTQAADRVTAFFEIWARKEAYIKALGRGLSHPLRQFDTTPGSDEEWTIVRDEKSNEVGGDWMVRNVILPDDYAGAIAIRRPVPRLELVPVTLPELALTTDFGKPG